MALWRFCCYFAKKIFSRKDITQNQSLPLHNYVRKMAIGNAKKTWNSSDMNFCLQQLNIFSILNWNIIEINLLDNSVSTILSRKSSLFQTSSLSYQNAILPNFVSKVSRKLRPDCIKRLYSSSIFDWAPISNLFS